MNEAKINQQPKPQSLLQYADNDQDLTFSLFLLRLQIQLMQIEHLNSELPALLLNVKQYLFSCVDDVRLMPDYALVICYPFSQECFIYHALPHPLAQRDIRLLKEQLLMHSMCIQPSIEQQQLFIGIHECTLLLTGHNFAVWRVYLNHAEDQHQATHLLQLLDQTIQKGFEFRIRQHNQIQNILQQERRDFSADLHDSIAQIIGFLRLKSAQLSQQCHQKDAFQTLREQTAELAAYTHYAYQQVRELITASRLTYQELDFMTAMKKIIAEFEHQSSIAFALDYRVPHLRVTAKQSVQLLYIIRESMSNIVRHSHASEATISIVYSHPNMLMIQIIDNGRGIQIQHKRVDSFGLEIMHERAERIGAVLTIQDQPPSGTCVKIKLELSAEQHHE